MAQTYFETPTVDPEGDYRGTPFGEMTEYIARLVDALEQKTQLTDIRLEALETNTAAKAPSGRETKRRETKNESTEYETRKETDAT